MRIEFFVEGEGKLGSKMLDGEDRKRVETEEVRRY